MLTGERIPLDEFAEDAKSARALIQSGEAWLEVVVWSWGVEFHLVATEPKPKSSLEAWPTPTSFRPASPPVNGPVHQHEPEPTDLPQIETT